MQCSFSEPGLVVKMPFFISFMDQNFFLQPTFLHNPETGLRLTFFDQVLYVMELRQDLEKGKATFTAVSEFLLTHPVLSFGVRDVAHSRLRHTEVLPAEEESESLTLGVYVCTGVLYFLIISVPHRKIGI